MRAVFLLRTCEQFTFFWLTHRIPVTPTPFNISQEWEREKRTSTIIQEIYRTAFTSFSSLFFTELLDGTMVTVSSNYQSSVLRGGPGRPQQSPNHPGQKRDRLAAGLTHPSGGRPVLPTESDSLNENTFPSVPVHRERDREHKTKRKRKCKRFALDPEQQGTSGKPTYPVNSHGRSFTGYSFVHPSFRF